MLKNLIRKWYWKYCDPDIVEMTRVQMKLISPKSLSTSLAEFSPEKREKFAVQMKALADNAGLKTLVEMLIADQAYFSATMAKDIKEVHAGKFSINGISLVLEVATELSTGADEKENKEFNKHDVV